MAMTPKKAAKKTAKKAATKSAGTAAKKAGNSLGKLNPPFAKGSGNPGGV